MTRISRIRNAIKAIEGIWSGPLTGDAADAAVMEELMALEGELEVDLRSCCGARTEGELLEALGEALDSDLSGVGRIKLVEEGLSRLRGLTEDERRMRVRDFLELCDAATNTPLTRGQLIELNGLAYEMMDRPQLTHIQCGDEFFIVGIRGDIEGAEYACGGGLKFS